MKATLPEYAIVLSENAYDILEELFEYKNKQFIRLFWLIKDVSDHISSLSYKTTSKKNTLKIEFTITKLKPETVLANIEKSITDEDDILITNKGKLIRIEIKNKKEDE